MSETNEITAFAALRYLECGFSPRKTYNSQIYTRCWSKWESCKNGLDMSKIAFDTLDYDDQWWEDREREDYDD
jgi:hypothetical protein